MSLLLCYSLTNSHPTLSSPHKQIRQALLPVDSNLNKENPDLAQLSWTLFLRPMPPVTHCHSNRKACARKLADFFLPFIFGGLNHRFFTTAKILRKNKMGQGHGKKYIWRGRVWQVLRKITCACPQQSCALLSLRCHWHLSLAHCKLWTFF